MSPEIKKSKSACLSELMPIDEVTDFGAFCGDEDQRSAVLLRGVSAVLGRTQSNTTGAPGGRVGVVVLHATPRLDADLGSLCAQRGVPFTRVGPYTKGRKSSGYDPLYGLDRTGVIHALDVPDNSAAADRVADYLSVMDELYRMDNSVSCGEYPYTLAMLLRLAGLSSLELDTKVLRRLPSSAMQTLSKKMTIAEAQLDVRARARRLEQVLAGTLGLANLRSVPKPQTSVVASVKRGEVISVYLPTADVRTINYLDTELDCLVRGKTPHLLVVSEIGLADTRLCTRMLAKHTGTSHHVGIATDNPIACVGEESKVSGLFAQLEHSFIFHCANSGIASPISRVFGNYERQVPVSGITVSHQPGKLFGARATQLSTNLVPEPKIRPEELARQGSWAIVTGRAYSSSPVFVESLNERA